MPAEFLAPAPLVKAVPLTKRAHIDLLRTASAACRGGVVTA